MKVEKRGKRLTALRWTLPKAASEFGIHISTLGKRVKAAGVMPGKDGRYSTRDIAAAVYGDVARQRERYTRARADMAVLDLLERTEQLCPLQYSQFVVESILVAMRQGMCHLAARIGHDHRSQELTTEIDNAVRELLLDLARGHLYEKGAAPAYFKKEFLKFLNRLLKSDPAVREWHEVYERVHQELNRVPYENDDENDDDGAAVETSTAPAGGGQEREASADAQ